MVLTRQGSWPFYHVDASPYSDNMFGKDIYHAAKSGNVSVLKTQMLGK